MNRFWAWVAGFVERHQDLADVAAEGAVGILDVKAAEAELKRAEADKARAEAEKARAEARQIAATTDRYRSETALLITGHRAVYFDSRVVYSRDLTAEEARLLGADREQLTGAMSELAENPQLAKSFVLGQLEPRRDFPEGDERALG